MLFRRVTRGETLMYDYFDKHGKKFLAVVGSLLVLAFLLPAGFGHNGGGGARLGKLDGKSVDAEDIQAAQNTLRSLERIVIPSREAAGQLVRLPQGIFGPYYKQFEQNPVLLYLLMHEASSAGAVVPDAAIEQFLRAPGRLIVEGQDEPVDFDRVNPSMKDALRADLRRALSIIVQSRRTNAAVKISRPLVDDALAHEAQQIKARVATFKAADYDGQVTAPTNEDLQRQFAAYSDPSKMRPEDNPYGFNYRVPERISIQWLSVPDAEVAKAVEATKSAELWDEDAIIYYQRNLSEFSAVTPPATQPTTKPFAEVRADVLAKMRAPLIEQQKRAVANRIVQQLNALHSSAAKQPSTGPAGVQFLGQPAYTFDSLKAVAAAVQKQTGVLPTAVAPAGLLSRADLEKQPGFGRTYTADRAMGFATGPGQLFETLRPLSNSNTAATLLDLGQPSPIFTGPDGLYVARVVGLEAAHAPESIDDIKAQVERDVRRSRAFDLAVAAAQATLDKAKTAGGLDKAGATIQTSDFFNAGSPTPAGLTGAYASGIVGPAFEALRGVKSAAELPAGTIAKLRKDGIAAVVEVIDVKTTLNTSTEAEERERMEQQLAQQTFPPTTTEQWFNFDAVSRRVGYTPDAARSDDAPKTPNAPAPANPFVPG
ncbi:MAG: hypothetical protein JWM57_558 [Phycisphaerales bacterium]|nr:hypothetical protein [Phycisphaerales bacterium]